MGKGFFCFNFRFKKPHGKLKRYILQDLQINQKLLITEDRSFVAKKNKQQRSSSLTCRRALVQKHYIHTAEGLMKEHKGDKNASISILRPKEVKESVFTEGWDGKTP